MIAWLASASARILLAVARVLPLGAVERLGAGLGRAAWAVDLRHRRVAVRNLARVFDRTTADPWVRRTARASFAAAGRSMASAAWLLGQPEQRVRRHLTLEGGDHFFGPIRAGQGVVAAVAHIGPWEVLAAAPLVLPGVPCATMARPIRNRGLDRTIRRMRNRFGVAVFEVPGAYRAAARFLKRPGVVGVLVDQYAGVSGRWAPFLGVPASTTRAHARLARATGAMVVPLSVRREGRSGFTIRAGEPIAAETAAEPDFLAEVNERLTRDVASAPDLWFWMHNRWRLPRRFLAGNPDPEARPRILVRGANWLGDAVMTLPAIRRIREMSPGAHIALMGPPGQADLFAAEPAIDEFVARPGGGPRQVARRIREGRFDAAFLFPNSLRSGLEVFLGDVPRRIGYRGHGRGPLLTDVVPRASAGPRHQARDYLEIVGAVGADTDLVAPLLRPSAADMDRARSTIRKRGRGVVGVHAGAQYGPAKRWPAERFAAVAGTFARRGYTVVLFGGKDEVALASEIASAAGCDGILNLAGRTDLGELAALLASCDVVVSNDTGPMHVAAAVGAPVVAVFGSTDPDLTAPLGKVRVVREPVPCSPCFRRTCPIDFPCMLRIDVERVVTEMESLLRETTGENPGRTSM